MTDPTNRPPQVPITEGVEDDLGVGMLIDAANRSSTQAASLRDEVAKLDKKLDLSNKVVKRLRFLTYILLVALLALSGLGIANRALFNEVRHQTDVIESCTSPEGECSKRNAERTAALLGAINDTNGNGKPDTQEILDAIASR